MRAVVADGFGEAWALREVPDPTPGPRDLLVQVEASGICYTDVQQLENPAYSGAFPRVPGHEPVGTIVAVGDDVSEWSVGERVGVAYAQRWCGYCHHCTGGYYEHCGQISQTGITVDGGHAELMVMDAGAAVGIPAALDPIDAAPILCAGFTVYSGICDSALCPGERCAVVGIGGLGHLGIQYAAALGAEVLAVTSAVDKQRELAELGAAQVVVANAAEVGAELERLGGVDVILHTGNRVGKDIMRGLRNYGRLSMMGVSESVVETTPREMIFKKMRIMGSSQGPRRRLHEVLELHARSGARTKTETYGLDDALNAYDRVRSGTTRYRAVLVPTAA